MQNSWRDKESQEPTLTRVTTRKSEKKWLSLIIILSLLGTGIASAALLKNTAPKPLKRPHIQSISQEVQVEEVFKTDAQVIVQAMATVIPARQLVVKSRVSGDIAGRQYEFQEGGIFKEGEQMLQIDPIDYELQVAQKKSTVISALYDLKLELGQQETARQEWELFKGKGTLSELDTELALRQPHLDKVKAAFVAAEAEFNQAQLDLVRTTFIAPFDALVLSTNVEVGSSVFAQDQVATLVGTDEFLVQVSVPADRLKWITIPGVNGKIGSEVRITSDSDKSELNFRTGTVVKLLGDVESEGGMARLNIQVFDPLDLQKDETSRRPLLLGEYVRVEILGDTLDGVVPIPRAALRDGDKVWIAGSDNKLEIREVAEVWRDSENVFVQKGVEEKELLVTSELSMPVDGMEINFNLPVKDQHL